MVFNKAGVKGEGEEIVLVNPQVYKFSKRLVVDEEGCLSFPGIYANVMVRINLHTNTSCVAVLSEEVTSVMF
jgi:peptide deformylase